MIDQKIKELIAVGASVSANCHPCVKYHTKKARDMGISKEDIEAALEVGKRVRGGAAGEMDKLIEEVVSEKNI